MSTDAQQKAKQKFAAETVLYGRSLKHFFRASWHIYEPGVNLVWGKHLDAICEHLEAVTRGEIRRLLILVPFRTSKSSLTSVAWPAWTWVKRPQEQFLTVSHSEPLAIRDARKHRNIVDSDWYQARWPLTISTDQNEKKRFENEHRGYRIAKGLGGGTIGEGGSKIICDDLMDRDQAFSAVEAATVIDQFSEKIEERLNDPARDSIVLIMQRLSKLDIAEHLLGRGDWEVLCLPMEYEPDHPTPSRTSLNWVDWRVTPGELLCEERFPRQVVEAFKRRPGLYAGQLQQRPVPKGGGLFQRAWFRSCEPQPGGIRVRAWDLASTDGDGDWTVGVRMNANGGRFVIEDVVRGQWSSGERDRIMRETAAKDGTGVSIVIPKDPGQAGVSQSESMAYMLSGYRVKVEPVSGSKELRADGFKGQAESGNVYVREGAAWAAAFLNELADFPYGVHDDCLDAGSSAYNRLTQLLRGSIDLSNLRRYLCEGESLCTLDQAGARGNSVHQGKLQRFAVVYAGSVDVGRRLTAVQFWDWWQEKSILFMRHFRQWSEPWQSVTEDLATVMDDWEPSSTIVVPVSAATRMRDHVLSRGFAASVAVAGKTPIEYVTILQDMLTAGRIYSPLGEAWQSEIMGWDGNDNDVPEQLLCAMFAAKHTQSLNRSWGGTVTPKTRTVGPGRTVKGKTFI